MVMGGNVGDDKVLNDNVISIVMEAGSDDTGDDKDV